MEPTELLQNLVATYERHGWRLRRMLLRAETRNGVGPIEAQFTTATFFDAPIDALWFSRSSHGNREAWELRLLADTPYALFETFAPEDDEDFRAAKRQQMETCLREYVAKR